MTHSSPPGAAAPSDAAPAARNAPAAPADGSAPGGGPVLGDVARRARGLWGAVRAGLRGSPGQLRLAGIVGVAGGLVFAVLGLVALQARANALADARTHAAQLVRLQQISADLVAADSQFTNGYLTYGLESSSALSSYETSVQDASRLIAEASRAEPADAAQLAEVNDALTRYTARVAAARANNKQGFQVATGYLRQASTLLQSSDSSPNLLPTLTDLATANAQRVDAAFASSRAATRVLVLAALGGLGLLVTAQFMVARRSHRVFNVPLVTGTAAVVVALLVAGTTMAVAQSRASRVKDNSYAATVALANARIAAYVGRSYASISLIYVGTGGDYATSQKSYGEQVARARTQLTEAAGRGADVGAGELDAWNSAVSGIYDTALGDAWTKAAGEATADAEDSANARFEAFDAATAPVLRQEATTVHDGLGADRVWLFVSGWLAAVLGALAAAAAWLGVSQRLEEYR